MLRAAAVLVGGILMSTLAVTAPASADGGTTCTKTDPLTGTCLVSTGGSDDPGSGGGGGAGSQGGGSGNGSTGGGGGDGDGGITVITINGAQCLPVGKADPQPPTSDPVWKGHTDGAIYMCLVPGFEKSPDLTLMYWAADAPAAPPPPPDPKDLARQAVKAMNLHAIAIGIVPEATPGSVGLIGMPTWMWVADPGQSTTGPITKTASAGGYTVSATAQLDRIVWSMGDGSSVTCSGAGTPYVDADGKSSSPDCGHTYTRQGRYAVGATSYWTVQWSGIGEVGTIPLDFTANTAITMGEAQVLVTQNN